MTDTPLPPPPAHVAPYVEALGVDGTLAFLEAFGGADLYVPATPGARSRLAEVVGAEAAQALAERADRLPRRVPLGKIWRAQVLRARGLPVAEIARKLSASDVAVRRWLKRGPPRDPRQLPLL